MIALTISQMRYATSLNLQRRRHLRRRARNFLIARNLFNRRWNGFKVVSSVSALLFLVMFLSVTLSVPPNRIIPRIQRELRRELLDWDRRLQVALRQKKFLLDRSSNIQIRVISLNRAKDRAYRTAKSLAYQNLSFQIVPAVDGLAHFNESVVKTFAGRKKRSRLEVTASLSSRELVQLYEDYDRFNLKNTRLRDSLHERLRFGCYVSHVMVWYDTVCNDFPFVVILEDDVVLGHEFLAKLNRLLNDLPEKWDLLYLNGCFRRLGPVFSKGLRLSRGGLCTFGYVISRKATDIFLTRAALKSEKPIDHMMDEEVLSGRMLAFHADPPLVYTRRDVKSTLAY